MQDQPLSEPAKPKRTKRRVLAPRTKRSQQLDQEAAGLAAAMPGRVLTPRVAAKFLGITHEFLGRMRRDPERFGEGPAYVMLGKQRVGYRVDDLNAWSAKRRRDAA